MNRPGKAPHGGKLADLFAADPDAAILRVLQDAAGKALDAGEVKAALTAAGVDKVLVDKAWKSIQGRRLRSDGRVAVEAGNRYRWAAARSEMTALDALDLLATGGVSASRRAELASVVRVALAGAAGAAKESDGREWVARVRTAEGEGIRLLAELASTVEGLIDNETPPDAMVRMVRARVSRSALEAVGWAGEKIMFDRKMHEPIGSPIRDGAPVFVVRPGYVWKKSDEDVLVLKTVVEQ